MKDPVDSMRRGLIRSIEVSFREVDERHHQWSTYASLLVVRAFHDFFAVLVAAAVIGALRSPDGLVKIPIK